MYVCSFVYILVWCHVVRKPIVGPCDFVAKKEGYGVVLCFMLCGAVVAAFPKSSLVVAWVGEVRLASASSGQKADLLL
jgi:hypothetical protein